MPVTEHIVNLLLEANIKVAVILLLVCLVLHFYKYRSSAFRFNILTVSLLSLLLLPVLTATLPGIPLPILLEIHDRMDPDAITPHPALQSAQAAMESRPHFSAILAQVGNGTLIEPASLGTGGYQPPRISKSLRLYDLLLLAWALVSAALLVRVAIGVACIHRSARRARPITAGFLPEQISAWRSILGLRRSVELRVTDADITPLTVGIFRPVILVPKQILRWPRDTCRTVLLHELIHVKRFDYLLHLIVRLIQSIYWLNPLVHKCARDFYTKQETVCDDQVILNGVKSKAYARQLLSVAMSVESPQFGVPFWINLAEKSKFERRVLAILNSGRNRRLPDPLSLIWVIVFSVLVIVPLAALKITDCPAPEPGRLTFEDGCWAKLESTNRLLISDSYKLLIVGVASFQEEWKGKSLDLPEECSFHFNGDPLPHGYLNEGTSLIRIQDASLGRSWLIYPDAQKRQVVLMQAPSADSAGLICAAGFFGRVPGMDAFAGRAGAAEPCFTINIGSRGHILSSNSGIRFEVFVRDDGGSEIKEGELTDLGGLFASKQMKINNK